MKDNIINAIFSFSGVSVLLAITGFLSALASMFIDVNAQVSVKWLMATLLILFYISAIFFKVIYDLSLEKRIPPSFERPISYIRDGSILVIKRNENFINKIIVGCYFQQDDIDRLAYLAVVHIVQDKVIQLKVQRDLNVLEEIPSTSDGLKNIVIRPVIPMAALEEYKLEEMKND